MQAIDNLTRAVVTSAQRAYQQQWPSLHGLRENEAMSVDHFSKIFFSKDREDAWSIGGESKMKPEYLRWDPLYVLISMILSRMKYLCTREFCELLERCL